MEDFTLEQLVTSKDIHKVLLYTCQCWFHLTTDVACTFVDLSNSGEPLAVYERALFPTVQVRAVTLYLAWIVMLAKARLAPRPPNSWLPLKLRNSWKPRRPAWNWNRRTLPAAWVSSGACEQSGLLQILQKVSIYIGHLLSAAEVLYGGLSRFRKKTNLVVSERPPSSGSLMLKNIKIIFE
jgi:hypothetical protein